MNLSLNLDLAFEFQSVSTIEEQSILFSKLSGIMMPSLLSGTFAFLREYGSWIKGNGGSLQGFPIFIPPNPSNALLFPTPLEDLRSTLGVAMERSLDVPKLSELLEKFTIDEHICHQSSHSLSGGERALVALAKISVLLPGATSAVLCNPSRWLHSSRRHLVADTLGCCNENADPRVLIHLEGEFDDASASQPFKVTLDTPKRVSWKLTVSEATVIFSERQFPDIIEEKTITYSGMANGFHLVSPTLLHGDNGVGKSTFAKLLAGLIPSAKGKCEIAVGNFRTSARLLFQDTPEQLFGLSPDDHLKWISDLDKTRRTQAYDVASTLQTRVASILENAGETVRIGSDIKANTLVQARIILAAERLVSGAKMLILDEPTWGLSRSLALAFLIALIEETNKRGIALLVISHEVNFPKGFFRSELCFTRDVSSDHVLIDARAPDSSAYEHSHD